MKIQGLFTLIILMVATYTFAADPVQLFASKADCLKSFTNSTGNTNPVAGENFCVNKYIKSAMDVCAENKLLQEKMKNSISSVDEPKYLQKFKNECILAGPAALAAPATSQQAQATDQATQQQNQIAQQQAAAAAQAQAQKNQATSAQQAQASAAGNIALLQAAVPLVDKVGSAYDDAVKAPAGKIAPPVAAAVKGVEKTEGLESPATVPFGESEMAARNAERLKSSSQTDPGDGTLGGGSGGSTIAENISSEQVNIAKTNADIDNYSKSISKDIPSLSKSAEKLKEDADGGGLSTPVSPITQESEGTSNVLTNQVNAAVSSAESPLSNSTSGSSPFVNTVGLFKSVKIDIQKYTTATKKTCTNLAEKTEFLCVEGSSPGAKAAKTFMDVAGPVLAVVNSAQKACSSMSKVTGMASAALTVAKGVCVVAKLSCDVSCGGAVADLNKTLASIPARINSALKSDYQMAMEDCEFQANPALVAACQTATQAKVTAGQNANTQIIAALKNENIVATPGTSPALVAKCAMKGKDIALLATNALGLLMAKNSADECDKKLAASGTAGSAVSTQQYCETPANSGTQFCKCKQNPNQTGCPGSAAMSIVGNDAQKIDGKGINSKTGAGLSGFAGGTNGTLGSTNGGGGGSNNPYGSASDPSKYGIGAGSPDGSAGAGGVGAGGDGSGGGSSGAGTAGNGSVAPEKKKWSFGAFASEIGSMFGGGSSGKNSKNFGNGNLNSSRQEAALKRKIASDRLAGEITSASGKSNWEKVHKVYLIKDNTNSLLKGY